MTASPYANQSPFVVPELKPEGTGGQVGVYQLNAASVSPSRMLGRDENGMPIEDTIPTVYWKPFVMLDGGINKVPLRTASVFSMEPDAVKYEQQVTTDLIQAGCIPLWVCPYTTEYAHLSGGGPLVKQKLADGEEYTPDCGGSPNGCTHLLKIAEKRALRAAKKHRIEIERIEKMKLDEIEKMREGIVGGVGEAIAKHLHGLNAAPGAAAKERLRSGKGEG